jgi:hypothetical protein
VVSVMRVSTIGVSTVLLRRKVLDSMICACHCKHTIGHPSYNRAHLAGIWRVGYETCRAKICLRSTSFNPPQIPCGSRIRRA